MAASARRSARREAQRFRYSKVSRSGFIELDTRDFSVDDLRQHLLHVPGVLHVVGHRLSKTEQNNASLGHAQERNWKMRTEALVAARANDFEFEITTTSNFSDTLFGEERHPLLCHRHVQRRTNWDAAGSVAGTGTRSGSFGTLSIPGCGLARRCDMEWVAESELAVLLQVCAQ